MKRKLFLLTSLLGMSNVVFAEDGCPDGFYPEVTSGPTGACLPIADYNNNNNSAHPAATGKLAGAR